MKSFKVLLVSLFLMTGCFGGYSPESKFYNLQAETERDVVSYKKLSVGIGDVILPDAVDRPQIVISQENSSEVMISETNRWSESLDTMIQGVLTADIAAYLPRSVVKVRELNENFKVIVSVEIVQFKMIEKQKAVLKAWWYEVDRYGNRRYRQEFVGEEEIGQSFDDFVKAESKLLNSLAKDIAEKISK